MSAKFPRGGGGGANPFSAIRLFRMTIGVANSFDPDQARHFVGPDLDPNCLQRLSADDTGR